MSIIQHLVSVLLMLLVACSSNTEYDVIISNGNVHPGNGDTPQIQDLGIIGEKIVAIGDLSEYPAKRRINAQGLEVSPGFIDLHAHLDPIFSLPECESMIRQGVTTALGGPDGGGPWALGDYMDSLEAVGTGMNVAYLVGHNSVRQQVMGLENREPSAEELTQMKQLVAQAMAHGAYGISTGLKYLPGTFSKTPEIIELSRVAAENQGIYTSHLREEGLGLIDAVYEAMVIGREADIPIVLTHHKVMGKPMWGKSVVTLAMVDSARAAGIDVMMDQYPYPASHTGIGVLIPPWCRAGGQKAFQERTEDPILKDSIKSGIIFNLLNDRGGADLKRVQFAKVEWAPELEGKTLEDWCLSKDLEPSLDNGAELVIQAQLNGGARCIFHAMDPADVKRIMQHPMTMVASDGRLVAPGIGHPHPRWYGTFPRVLGQYVRDSAVIDLPTGIHKMTGMPAARLGLIDRGLIKEGYHADLVIFNAATIKDRSTFTDPHHYPEGIEFVLVNGQLTVDQGQFKDIRKGKVLKKNNDQ
ncbi:MAG: D-aminoacylase [Cyclobacteriaceae bacterium]|nr:D-aminoacylase [Cyclobacteriaceae bacterium]